MLGSVMLAGLSGCAVPSATPGGRLEKAAGPAIVLPSPAMDPAETPDTVAEILRLAPRPATAELLLFATHADGSLRPFRRGAAAVGTDTNLSAAEAGMELVLLVRAPGFIPQAYAFVPRKIADFFPDLRRMPTNGPFALQGEAEELGDEVRRLFEAGKIVDPPAGQ